MENLENKKVEKNNKNVEAVKKEIKLIKLNKLDKNESLILKDDYLKDLYKKKLSDLDVEDFLKFHLSKVTIEKRQRWNSSEFDDYVSIQICKGLSVGRRLDELEVNLIKANNPQLYKPTGDMYVPVKLICFEYTKDGRTSTGFKYVAFISDGVVVGNEYDRRTKKATGGFIGNKELNIIKSYNMANKDKTVKFVYMSNDDLIYSLDDNEDISNYLEDNE